MAGETPDGYRVALAMPGAPTESLRARRCVLWAELCTQDLIHRSAEASLDALLRRVPALPHDPTAADHHIAHQRRVAGENEAVEQRVLRLAVQRRRGGIQ